MELVLFTNNVCPTVSWPHDAGPNDAAFRWMLPMLSIAMLPELPSARRRASTNFLSIGRGSHAADNVYADHGPGSKPLCRLCYAADDVADGQSGAIGARYDVVLWHAGFC